MNPTVAFILQSQQDSLSRRALGMWTVYDYPDGYIACKFEVKGGELVATKETLRTTDEPGLELLRDAFQQAGLVCMPRSEGDDPQIIETWYKDRVAAAPIARTPTKGKRGRAA